MGQVCRSARKVAVEAGATPERRMRSILCRRKESEEEEALTGSQVMWHHAMYQHSVATASKAPVAPRTPA